MKAALGLEIVARLSSSLRRIEANLDRSTLWVDRSTRLPASFERTGGQDLGWLKPPEARDALRRDPASAVPASSRRARRSAAQDLAAQDLAVQDLAVQDLAVQDLARTSRRPSVETPPRHSVAKARQGESAPSYVRRRGVLGESIEGVSSALDAAETLEEPTGGGPAKTGKEQSHTVSGQRTDTPVANSLRPSPASRTPAATRLSRATEAGSGEGTSAELQTARRLLEPERSGAVGATRSRQRQTAATWPSDQPSGQLSDQPRERHAERPRGRRGGPEPSYADAPESLAGKRDSGLQPDSGQRSESGPSAAEAIAPEPQRAAGGCRDLDVGESPGGFRGLAAFGVELEEEKEAFENQGVADVRSSQAALGVSRAESPQDPIEGELRLRRLEADLERILERQALRRGAQGRLR